MSFDPKRAREYLKTIDLIGTPRGILAFDAVTEEGALFEKGHTQIVTVGSTLLSFAAGIMPEVREVVTDSVLLSHLIANNQTPAGAPTAWFKASTEVLENLGWALEPAEWVDYSAHGKAAEVHDKIVEVMAGLVGVGPEAAAVQTVRATLQAMQDMEADEACPSIFNREAKKGKIAHFQVTHIEKQMDSAVHALMLGCTLDAPTPVGQLLYFNIKEGKARFHASVRHVEIDRPGLLELGPAIRAKLRAYQADYRSPILDL